MTRPARTLALAGLAHALHDGFTDMIYVLLPVWQTQFALVEADISRFKRVIGGSLRSRTDGRRTTKMGIAVGALNRMLELGRPAYVRVA